MSNIFKDKYYTRREYAYLVENVWNPIIYQCEYLKIR